MTDEVWDATTFGLSRFRRRLGRHFFLFSIIRYLYGNGRSLLDWQALRAALVLLFDAVVFHLLLRILEEFRLTGQLYA